MSVWTGRVDEHEGPDALRWHQRVQPWTPDAPPGLAILGFACDEGVRRNGGRVGAKDGPRAIRQMLANLAWQQESPVYDAGDVACTDGNLEAAQEGLANAVSAVLMSGQRPLVLGGGHETAVGTFLGLARTRPDAAIGIINFDAHFDLRLSPVAHSGTPFAQIADWCAANDRPFRYFPLGIALSSNTQALFERSAELRVEFVPDYSIDPVIEDQVIRRTGKFVDSVDLVYLSIDLDVLPAAAMPAVSAPAGRGVSLPHIDALIVAILHHRKTAAVDVVELNPAFDIDGRGARTAARIAWDVAKKWEMIGEDQS